MKLDATIQNTGISDLTNDATSVAEQGKNAKKDAELKKACADFESVFMQKMLEGMRKTIPKSGLLDGGMQEEIYTSMFDEELSKLVANGKGMGLGDMMYKQMQKQVK